MSRELPLAPAGETMFPPRTPFFCSVGELQGPPHPLKLIDRGAADEEPRAQGLDVQGGPAVLALRGLPAARRPPRGRLPRRRAVPRHDALHEPAVVRSGDRGCAAGDSGDHLHGHPAAALRRPDRRRYRRLPRGVRDKTRWYNRLLEINIQNLAAVPSIVYGILGSRSWCAGSGSAGCCSRAR